MPARSDQSRGRCRYSAQVPVIAGFGILILLLIGVAAIGVSHIRTLSKQLTAIVVERNLKAELATSMKALHEARYQTILLASELDDPFDRDEQHMQFDSMAQSFIGLRDRFLALPLDAAELAAWGQVRKSLPMVENVANDAFDLIQADRRDQAKQLIKHRLKQHQVSMMAEWDRLVEMQRAKNAQAVAAAAAASDRARRLVLGLSAVALLVGIGVALVVIRLSRRLEAELFAERERALVTLGSIGDAVIRFDQSGQVGYLNPIAELLLGASMEGAEPLPVSQALRLYERESRSDLTAVLLGDVFKGLTYVLPPSACLLSTQGMEYEVEGKCSAIRAADGGIIGGVLVMSDVTEAHELQRKLLWHSDHDTLTGLANRYGFDERLLQLLGDKRVSELPSALLLIGLDQLKKVRDQSGYACSDEMICQVAHLLNLRVRETDLLARLGEDEFGILLPHCSSEMAERLAEQIRDSVMACTLTWEGKQHHVGAHVAVVHLAGKTHEEALMLAYSALHEAETRGPGSVVVRPLQKAVAAETGASPPADI